MSDILKNNEWIRFENGDIMKFDLGIEIDAADYSCNGYKVVKHSFNKIDVIFPGDKVNGLKVVSKVQEINITYLQTLRKRITEDEIIEVTTKEHLKQINDFINQKSFVF